MSSSAAQPLVMERRRFLRFPARVRVAYDLQGRWAIGGTQDLSQGGMALVGGLGTGLEAGAQATFLLHLPDGERPQPALGDILGVAPETTRVRFSSGQRELVERVRRYAEIIVVPTLESSLSDAVHDRNRLVALAGLYHELGRDTQALDLYHAALDLGASNRDFLEAVAPAMLQQVRPFGPRGATLLAQLRSAVTTSLAESPSATLEAVARALDANQVVATPEGIEVVPALPEHEIAALRDSIRKNREALYKGFLQLLEERNRLRRLEQGAIPATPPAPGAPAPRPDDVVPLLASIRSQLESLNDPPPATARIASAPPPVVVAGPPPPARVAAAAAEPVVDAPAPRRRRSTVVGLIVGVLLLAGIGVALWVARLSPREVEGARQATSARTSSATPADAAPRRAESVPAAQPATTAVPADSTAPSASPSPAAPGEAPAGVAAPTAVTTPARAARPERAGRGRAAGAREARGTSPLPPEPPPPPPSEALAGGRAAATAHAGTHVELALRHLKERKVTLAVQEARAALVDEPGNATAYRILGIAYGMLGQDAQSLAAFERFLELAPDDPAAERVRAALRKHKAAGSAR